MISFFDRYSSLIIFGAVFIEVVLTVLTVCHYIRLRRQTLYSYQNASFLGGSVFMVLTTVFSVLMLFNTNDSFNPALYFLSNISQIAVYFPILLLPFMILFFLFMGVSNISLMRHEGKTVHNTVGSILGFALIAATAAGVFGWDIVYENVIFKIYSQGCQWITVFDKAIPQFLVSLLCYLECLLLGTVVHGIEAAKHKPAFDKDYVIILGCAIAEDGRPLPLLRGRIDRAIRFSKDQLEATGKKVVFVPSGGKGGDECVSEAESMRDYLISQGVDANDIIVENRSTSTLENMMFSKALIDADGCGGKVLFSTTNYHVFRSGICANRAGLAAEGVGSKTKWYFWPNAFAREYVALLSSNRKAHVFNSVILLVLSLACGYATYLSLM